MHCNIHWKDIQRMPHSKVHDDKKVKNWTLFFILLGVTALFFYLGIIRLSGE